MNDVVIKLNVVETPTEWILMCESPAGGVTKRIPAPFTPPELQAGLHELETSVMRSYSKVLTRRAVSPEATALKFGRRLSDVLLSGEARVLFEECRMLAKESGGEVRVLLETDGPSVAQIPWEFTVDPRVKDDYLALRLSLARHLRVSTPVPPLAVKPPLRILGVHAQPHDRPTLDFAAEQESVAAIESVSSSLVEVTWLEGDRWSVLADKLDEGGWHVLHFVGHGGFDQDTETGFLELSDDTGAALPVAARRIGAAAARSGDLRLVVLNACESAATGAAGMFSSTAAKLMMEGIPAVVAMQYEITDPAALAFAAAFYEALARGKPVDQAVTKAREIVRATQNSLEFATAVLYLASQQTQLFRVERPPQAAPPASAPQARPGSPTSPQPVAFTPLPAPQRALAEPDSTWKTGVIGRINDWLGTTNKAATSGAQKRLSSAQANRPTSQPASAPRTQVGHRPTPPRTAEEERPARPRSERPAPQLDPNIRRIAPLEKTDPIAPARHAALGPRDLLAIACTDGAVRAWKVRQKSWAALCTLPAGVQPRLVAWSPWPRHVATSQDDGTVVVWDLEKEVPIRVVRPACHHVASMAFSHNGKWLAIVGADRTVQIFDGQGKGRSPLHIPASKTPAAWGQDSGRVGPCAFAPDDRHLVVASNDGAVLQLDAHGNEVTSWPHVQPVCGLAVSSDRVATCTVEGRLRLWRWSGDHVRRHELPARVEQMTFAPDESLLATAATDRRLTTWSADGEALGTAALAGRPVGIGVGAGYAVTITDTGVIETWAVRPAEKGTAG